MRTHRMTRMVPACALAAGLAALPLPCLSAADASPGPGSVAETAQIVPPPFLPWPPPIPQPAGSVWPEAAPSTGSGDPSAATVTLKTVLAAVQDGMDRLRQLIEALREAAAAALAQIVLPLPIGMPGADSPAGALTQLAGLPDAWRAIMAGAFAKLQPPDAADTVATRHERDIAGSGQLFHEAATIAAADQQVITGLAQQEVAASSSQALAAAAVRDAALPLAIAASQTAADALTSGARDLPSSRAGIELLVAGTGAGLRNQAALISALADRIAGLMQQSAQLSGQVGGLASTIGILTERALQADRETLDGRLGLADAARGGGMLLQQLLLGAGEPADEIRIAPLY